MAALLCLVAAGGGVAWWLITRDGKNPIGDHRREKPANGEAEKLYLEGLAFENGNGRPIDGTQAAAAYQRASDLGHAAATARLARMHNYGYGVRRDLARARQLAERAAGQGDPLACNLTAVLSRGQHRSGPEVTRAVQYLEKAAEMGLPLGMLNLAEHLREAVALPQNSSRADELDRSAFAAWRDAASQNDPEAHFWVGYCYEIGRGTNRDLQAAFREYQAAAQAGVPRAITAVAVDYATGQGTAADPAQALTHFDRAIQAGWMDANLALAPRLVSGSGVPKDPARARSLYEEAGPARLH
jgi:TPR repeat protein